MPPDADDLPETLLDLAVPHEGSNELVAQRRTVTGDPGTPGLLDDRVEELLRDPDETGRTSDRGRLPASAPAALRDAFAVYVFLAALPHRLAHHRERGIPPEISRRTLADLGRHLAVHRRRHGLAGVQPPSARPPLPRGAVPAGPDAVRAGATRAAHRAGARGGRPGRGTGDGLPEHPPPGFHGPLTPSARDRSPARPGSSSRTVSAVAVTTPTPTGTGKRAEPVG
ncbi:acyltransferase domain-containing protein [Streptomyces griseochromogenes]|uniref:acyltransferase domain-containing protein n=1 Tax=Streptomyces griseochromogenes TaxID=68214 RepID=UPI00379FA5EE